MFVETIKIKNGWANNIELHQYRMNKSRYEVLGISQELNLETAVHTALEHYLETGGQFYSLMKCRVLYDTYIYKIEFHPYTIKPIRTLQMVQANNIEYTYKYINRDYIQTLLQYKGNADDILIIKNNVVTDTSYCNIVFHDGNQWVTPSTPLLMGTKRQLYLNKNIITHATIYATDVSMYKIFKVINAMIDLEDSENNNIDNIYTTPVIIK
ncbi:MAG: aminotransferase class IV [Bacteroidales bacterium]